MSSVQRLQFVASASLIGLIVLTLVWEAALAPTARSVLIVKSLPLLLPLFGILRGKRYTYQWSAMLILAYFSEGVVRAYAENGVSAALAGLEVVLSVVFFCCAIFYARLTRVAPA